MEQHFHTAILFHLVRTFIVYGYGYARFKILELFKALEPLQVCENERSSAIMV